MSPLAKTGRDTRAPLASLFNKGRTSAFVACSAGARPKSSRVTIAAAALNARTWALSVKWIAWRASSSSKQDDQRALHPESKGNSGHSRQARKQDALREKLPYQSAPARS